MILSSPRNPYRRPAGILLSLASHAAVLLIVFLLTLHWGRVRPIYRDSRCCTAQLYWNAPAGVSDSSPTEAIRHAVPSPIPVPQSSRIENPLRPRQPRKPRHSAPAQNHLARSGTPSLQQQQQTVEIGRAHV